MSLPVSHEYLAKALLDNCLVSGKTLLHKSVGDLFLPTGHLVACDPLVCPEAEPFAISLPPGAYPVVLSIADMGKDQRVAFATIHLGQGVPTNWKMMTVADQDISKLKPEEFFGYGVDSGTGCFMDRATGKTLEEMMSKNQTFFETIDEEMDETYRHTWSWLNMKFGDANLIAFSSGYGDGAYATYAGFASNGEITVIVTDFSVIPN